MNSLPAIENRLDRMERMLKMLLRDNQKKNPLDLWVDEGTAAEMLSRSPRFVRRAAKDGKLPIRYKTQNGRSYRYNKRDITKYIISL